MTEFSVPSGMADIPVDGQSCAASAKFFLAPAEWARGAAGGALFGAIMGRGGKGRAKGIRGCEHERGVGYRFPGGPPPPPLMLVTPQIHRRHF